MKYLVEPWDHQRRAIDVAKDLPNYALFFEPGTGKTATAINLIRHKSIGSSVPPRTLVFCPPRVVPNWRAEFCAHSEFEPRDIVLLTGSGRARCKIFSAQAWRDGSSPTRELEKKQKVFVTNYESLRMAELFRLFQDWAPEVIIFDESHRLKNSTAQRSKLAYVLANPHVKKKGQVTWLKEPIKYLLSGTPVLNSPMDLFQQFKILDNGATFGRNFILFRSKYFRDRNAYNPHCKFPNWEIMTKAKDGLDALTELSAAISKISMRVEKKDCLDLPPLVKQVISVPMAPEQKRLYTEMKKDFITFFKENPVTASLAITKSLRLLQITSGFVKTAETEIALPENPKLAALEELVEDLILSGKVLIWAVFKMDFRQIGAMLEKKKISFVEVHGEISAKKQDEAVKRFQEDPEVKVFLSHPGSGGIGINLTQSKYSVVYSRTWNAEHADQSEARNYRGGSEVHDKITHYDLVCENSVDEIVVESLNIKTAMSARLFSDFINKMN